MKNNLLIKIGIIIFTLISTTSFGQIQNDNVPSSKVYEPTWESLAQHGTAPAWYEDAVFGIIFHWGVYSVPAYKSEKYPRDMYKPGHVVYEHHCKKYGFPPEFGYKDFIPMFTAEKWDPDRWARLFKKAGADFAGPVAEHHDGFSMWDTKYSRFNAKNMGPHRDIVSEMARAVRKQNMKVVITFHHLRWDYYDAGRLLCPQGMDVNDPENADLYGPIHTPGDTMTEAYKQTGYLKVIEVIDKYHPDQLQFDGGTLVRMGEERVKKLLAYYYNAAEQQGRDVAVSRGGGRGVEYKPSETRGKEVLISEVIPISCSIQNIENHFPKKVISKVNPHRWQNITPVPGFGWSYLTKDENKTPEELHQSTDLLIDGIIDVTSKNGVTLLGLAPKADGTLPEGQIKVLNQLGEWMRINKVALYGVDFHNPYKAGSLRFTSKGDVMFVIDLEKPVLPLIIPNVTLEIGSEIKMLGDNKKLSWHEDSGNLVIDELPDPLPCDYAWVFKIKLNTKK